LRREGKPIEPGNWFNRNTLQKLFNKIDNKGNYKTNYQHGDDGEINTEIFFLNSNISRQSTDPM